MFMVQLKLPHCCLFEFSFVSTAPFPPPLLSFPLSFSRILKTINGLITLSVNDNGDKYECTGTDPEYDSNNTGIYSCNGDELVVDR